ncbi:unnamed protein product [Periconia digitata]|uniref:Uncharacterized protein n=1 Tax=Periconia digitata TaxID=1303443 RepID=A0A9W4U429_9PLEO|nr:unnamed protein product [Periconia digitata]
MTDRSTYIACGYRVMYDSNEYDKPSCESSVDPSDMKWQKTSLHLPIHRLFGAFGSPIQRLRMPGYLPRHCSHGPKSLSVAVQLAFRLENEL